MGENRMDLKTLHDTPPWEWPEDAGEMFLEILRDERADESERLLAAELAGDSTVIDDELADALMSILLSGHEPEDLRARAAISLGPALESAYIDGFDDPEYVPISEQTFIGIQKTLRKPYMDAGVPKEVRRRILEASVRAPQDWHRDAVRAAYSSDDEDWNLTAVFSMRFVRGFENQILESLDSTNPDIHYEAVCAAGNWEVDAAWSHIAGLVTTEETDKYLLLAAIEALANIRPDEASEILVELIESDDEDIVEAAYDAMGMAQALAGLDWDDEEEDDDEWLH
jgi:HEAT repeat protein